MMRMPWFRWHAPQSVAEAAKMPEWRVGNEFKATRDRMLHPGTVEPKP